MQKIQGIKKILLFFGLTIMFFVAEASDNVSEKNKLKQKAKQAYLDGNFEQAIENYLILVDSFKVREAPVLMNLAHSYFRTNSLEEAKKYYLQITRGDDVDDAVKSVALQQLGIIHHKKEKDSEGAKDYFKQSLIVNASNEEARYNYELLSKLQTEEQSQNKDNQQNGDNKQKDQSNKDDSSQKDNNDQEGNENEQNEQQGDGKEHENEKNSAKEENNEPDKEKDTNKEKQQPTPTQQRLKKYNLTEEQAQAILDAMMNSEMKYIQQNKRKPQKNIDKSNPDW